MMIGFLSLLVQRAMGQVATSLYFMDNLPQSNILNPAFDPNYNFYFGLPVINNTNISLRSDIGANAVYSNGGFFWNSEDAYNAFVNELPVTSYLSAELNTSIFNLGFAVGTSGYFHFAYTHRFDMTFGIPRDVFHLNDLTIPHDLSGFEMQARWYNEYAIGYSHAINDQLVVGAKVKILGGVANASLSFDVLDFNTSTDVWEIKVDGVANISAPLTMTTDEYGYPSDFKESIDFGTPSELLDYMLKSYRNPGFGLDLGAEYEVIPKLKISASLIDLGKINWKRNVTNFSMNGVYEFEGFKDIITTDGEGIVNVDENVMEQLEDTLKKVVAAEEGSSRFSNTLTPKLFFGAEYELTQSLSFGVLYKARFIRQEVRQNIYLNANANFKRVLTLGINYNYGIGTQNSYGGVIGLRLTPFYLYFAADVLPGYSGKGSQFVSGDGEPLNIPVSLPADFSAANFQFGINITMGERRIIKEKAEKRFAPPLFKENTENSSLSYPF